MKMFKGNDKCILRVQSIFNLSSTEIFLFFYLWIRIELASWFLKTTKIGTSLNFVNHSY